MVVCVINVHFVGPNVWLKENKPKWKKGHKHYPAKPKGVAHMNKSNPKILAKAEDWTRQLASFLFILDQGPIGDLHKRTKSLRMN